MWVEVTHSSNRRGKEAGGEGKEVDGHGIPREQSSEDFRPLWDRVTGGARMNRVAAAGTVEGGLFIGEVATVVDAEVLGIAGIWQKGYRVVALDSKRLGGA